MQAFNDAHSVTMINFYAPWCPWESTVATGVCCSRDSVARDVQHEFTKHALEIGAWKSQLAEHEQLCRKHHIQGYPTVRIFTRGSDLIAHGRHTDHASYHGDRP